MLEIIAHTLQIILYSILIFMGVYSFIGLIKLQINNKKEWDKYILNKNQGVEQMNGWFIFSCKEEIITKRNDKGWTQLELAEYSGIHPNAIKEFEDGVRIPSNPIQMLLHRTFKRLDNTIDDYNRLSPLEKEKFHIKLGLPWKNHSITRES